MNNYFEMQRFQEVLDKNYKSRQNVNIDNRLREFKKIVCTHRFDEHICTNDDGEVYIKRICVKCNFIDFIGA